MTVLPSYVKALSSAIGIVRQVCTVEKIPIETAIGRFVAVDIIADRDLPPYHRSQMDGYAVVASEVSKGVSMKVTSQVAAGETYSGEGEQLTCVAIATGAPVPDCFDAVVQHEMTDCGEDIVLFDCDDIQVGKSIHPKGVDARAGDVLIPKYSKILPQHIGIAASVGVHEIDVVSKPRVIVITSGDEVVAAAESPLPHQIRNGNNPMISSAFFAMGCEVVETHHLWDDLEETKRTIASALDGRCDLVVTIGGISAGKRDFFPTAFAHSEVELVVKGAKIQPGKPVVVGKHANTVVLGLPGNPVSALACCTVFGWPIVRTLQGMSAELPWQQAPLSMSVNPNPHRLVFRPCQLVDGKVSIPHWQGSGDLVHTAATQGLVQLPSSEEALQCGELVSCLAFPW